MTMAEEITQEEAIELIRESDGCMLVTFDLSPVPTLGTVDEDEIKLKADLGVYDVGEVPEPDGWI